MQPIEPIVTGPWLSKGANKSRMAHMSMSTTLESSFGMGASLIRPIAYMVPSIKTLGIK